MRILLKFLTIAAVMFTTAGFLKAGDTAHMLSQAEAALKRSFAYDERETFYTKKEAQDKQKKKNPSFMSFTPSLDEPSEEELIDAFGWYRIQLLPWIDKNIGKPFELYDDSIEKYHGFNVEVEASLPEDYRRVCSSTRIHKNWILTASHCLSEATDLHVYLKEKTGRILLIRPTGVYFFPGRTTVFDSTAIAYSEDLKNVDRFMKTDFVIMKMDIKYDFLLVRINVPFEEMYENNWPDTLVVTHEDSSVELDLFMVAKYGNYPVYNGVAPLRFKEMGCSCDDEKKDTLITFSNPDLGVGHSGGGLFGKQGMYGIFSQQRYGEELFIPFSQAHIRYMQTIMQGDFKRLKVVHK
ncbi:hypothetical protein Dip510_000433 [Elusimicrobium posterum]|uniref:trypsin-like serine protease n=1 Tax=Elusimicrobium posterum TaxID=3116653 RepID=UPI003C738546